MIVAAAIAAASLPGAPVKQWPLDDRAAYAVRLGVEAPTTVLFPGALTALEGANVSARVEDNPAVLLSHQSGSNFFSLRATRPDANGAINVVYLGKLYALTFTTGGEPDRAISFRESVNPAPTIPATRRAPIHWLTLLDLAKRRTALVEQYPAIAQRMDRVAPGTSTVCGGVTATIEEVFRFEADDALVFRLRLENPIRLLARYSSAELGVRVGTVFFPSALTDASGTVPAQSATVVWIVVAAASDAERANLSLKNTFVAVVPPVP